MGQKRWNGLASLYVQCTLYVEILILFTEQIIDKFSNMKKKNIDFII